jgi:hypothetical protein
LVHEAKTETRRNSEQGLVKIEQIGWMLGLMGTGALFGSIFGSGAAFGSILIYVGGLLIIAANST